jgi:hypothetical protein
VGAPRPLPPNPTQSMLDRALLPSQVPEYTPTIEHRSFDSYLQGLRDSALLLVPDSSEVASERLPFQAVKARLHKFDRYDGCIALNTFSASDLPLLRSIGGSVLIRRIGARLSAQFTGETLLRRMERLGFRIFFEHGSDSRCMSELRQYRLINLVEFAVSDPFRLAAYPAITNGNCFSVTDTPGRPRRRTVVVLDLVQDFEILRPLILKCVTSTEWRDVRVSVSELVAKSHLWEEVKRFLAALHIPWFQPIGPVDVANALGAGKDGKGVLITASESTAPNHRFNYDVCRIAPPRTAKITIQHGYECIGLRHHSGHDRAFLKGVRFGSDYVFTWGHLDGLPNLHPADRGKCIPVGVVKGFAEDAAAMEDSLTDADYPVANRGDLADRVPFPVLIAENLHSTRFIDPARHKRFRDFILDVNDSHLALTIRSHPARRTLEKGKDNQALTFLTGTVQAKQLRQFGIVVSPPSTILLDAVLAGVPAAVWSERAHVGDCANYVGVPNVCDLGQFVELCGDRRALADIAQANYQWAARNVCAFNGVPQAWSRLNELIH